MAGQPGELVDFELFQPRLLKPHTLPIPSSNGSSLAGRVCNVNTLRPACGPTAIFAANDEMALAALICAQTRGYDVPRDLSIVGIDDAAMSSIIVPGLTTIRPPLAEMAEAAARMIIALKSGPARAADAAAGQCLPYTLVVRESTAPPPAMPARAP